MSNDLHQISNLKILLTSKAEIGVGRSQGFEVIPYTHYFAKQHGIPLLDAPKSTPMPEHLKENLRPYQISNIEKLLSRKSSANFSEPRTGKTPTALRLFQAKGIKTFLIVAPASSLYQWKAEVHNWTPNKAEVITGLTKPLQRKELFSQFGKSFNVLIVSYDTLKLVQRQGKMSGMLPEIIKLNFEGVIVDEAHRIRNRKSLQAKAIFALSKIPHKHVLTGTPAHGKLYDVFPILHFLYPDVFTGYWRFVNYYFNTFKINYQKANVVEIGKLKNQYELIEFIERISVQNKRKEVMKWLPDKEIITIKLPPLKEQLAYINQMVRTFEVGDIIAENVLTQLIRVRQLCNDPRVLGLPLKEEPPKITWLRQYLEDNPDKPTIVFSNLTSFLRICAEKLNITQLIVGDVSSLRREELRNDFQSGKINILFINTQAGKEALTLDRAEVAIFLDTYPPYGDIEQAENRFTTTKQENAEKDHIIIRLMIENTYDETLYKLVDKRASEAEIINNFKKFLKGGG